MELCLEHVFSGARRPCLGFGTFAGAIVNIAVLVALAALLTLVVRVLHDIRRESPVTENDVRRIVLRGVNPWLFVGGYLLWLGAYALARMTG